MRTVKREEDRTAGHQRSTSRYSINRIQPAGKSPDVAAQRSLKPSNSFLDLRSNKENEDTNSNRLNNAATMRDRRRPAHRGLEDDMMEYGKNSGYSNIPNQDDMADLRKRYNAELTEKDMTIMELKNSLRKCELEVKKRDKVVLDLEKLVESKDKTIASLSSQNGSLSSALELLKGQEEQLQGLHQSSTLQCQSIKKQLASRAADCRRLQEQLAKANKDMEIFNSLEPRLKQLEQLQDRLIDENQRAKDQRQMFISTMHNIQRILKGCSERHPELRQIESLIGGFLL